MGRRLLIFAALGTLIAGIVKKLTDRKREKDSEMTL